VKNPLTQRQADVLAFIRAFVLIREYPPSVRDIANGIVPAVNGMAAYRFLKILAAKGWIYRLTKKSRWIRILW